MTKVVVHPFLLEMLRGSEPENLLPLASASRDWEEIVRDAATHGLIPPLYKSLKRADHLRRLPPGLADRLEGQFYGMAARNLMLSTELGGILRAFEDAGVSCAPLRGLALVERLYGDITARPMGDLDLLVRKEELPNVGTILGGLGFGVMDRRPGFAQTFSYRLEYFKDRHGWFLVEPHWALTYPPFVSRLDMEQVWKRCVRGKVVGVEAWVLAPEDLLLHLCLHLTHRGGSAPLLWFYELDRFLRQEQEVLDWERFLSLARDAKVELLLSHALSSVRALFGTPIPDRALDQLAREPQRIAEGRLQRLLIRASHWDSRESFAVLMALEGLRAKLRYVFMLLFPSPNFMRFEYGLTSRVQLTLAYFRLFCRLSWKGLKGVAMLLFQARDRLAHSGRTWCSDPPTDGRKSRPLGSSGASFVSRR